MHDAADIPHAAATSSPTGQPRPVRILTVCLGNVCRSPAAEAMIRRAASMAGVGIEVDSAGTSVKRPGKPANRRTRKAAARLGLEVSTRTREVVPSDLFDFDLAVVMDNRNLAHVEAMRATHGGTIQVRLFRSFDPDAKRLEIPDPYSAPPAYHDGVLASMAGAAAGVVDWAAASGAPVVAVAAAHRRTVVDLVGPVPAWAA